MALNLHPADLSDIEKIGTATHFTVHLRTGPHEKVTKRAKTLAAAIRAADELGKTPGGRKPLIYAITPDDMTVHVPAAMIAQARQEIEQKATAGLNKGAAAGRQKDGPRGSFVAPRDTSPTLDEAGIDKKPSGRAGVEALARVVEGMVADNPEAFARPARKAATAPRRAASKGARPQGRRAEIAGNAAKGILPPVPDFSAETHKRFRGKLAEIVKLVEAGDVAALKAFPIKPYSSSPKALDKYRNLAVTALETKGVHGA